MKNLLIGLAVALPLLLLPGCTETLGSGKCIVLEAGDADAVSTSLGKQILAHNRDLKC